MTKHIPNLITGLNIFSGCMAVTFALFGMPVYAALFILLAAIFDFCDGLAARLLNAYSDMGKELDSLADLISFGFAPAAIAFNMLSENTAADFKDIIHWNSEAFILIIPFVMVVFSGFRLAKFNIDTRQTSSFLGLPTPANAILWASFPLLKAFNGQQWIIDMVFSPLFIIITILATGILLVSEIPMFSFKVKSLGFRDNAIRYIFLLTLAVLFVLIGHATVVFIIPLYIVFSLFSAYVLKD